jgi:hypothetical protein
MAIALFKFLNLQVLPKSKRNDNAKIYALREDGAMWYSENPQKDGWHWDIGPQEQVFDANQPVLPLREASRKL